MEQKYRELISISRRATRDIKLLAKNPAHRDTATSLTTLLELIETQRLYFEHAIESKLQK